MIVRDGPLASDATPVGSVNRQIPFLLVSGRDVDWALDASTIRLVHAVGDWQGDKPLDVAGILSIPKDDSELSRILVVTAGSGEVVLQADGTVHIQDVALKDILPLPSLIKKGIVAEAIEGVVLAEGKRPVVVIRPAGLKKQSSKQN